MKTISVQADSGGVCQVTGGVAPKLGCQVQDQGDTGAHATHKSGCDCQHSSAQLWSAARAPWSPARKPGTPVIPIGSQHGSMLAATTALSTGHILLTHPAVTTKMLKLTL